MHDVKYWIEEFKGDTVDEMNVKIVTKDGKIVFDGLVGELKKDYNIYNSNAVKCKIDPSPELIITLS